MTQYINKSALVAEIEKRIKETESMKPKFDQFWAGQISAFKGILKILDILEAKEVDLEKEMDKEWSKCEPIDEGMGLEIASIEHEQFDNIAKHFYELGFRSTRRNV